MLTSCVDKYTPKLEPAPRNLVVEALITNMPEVYTVNITHLQNVASAYGDSVTGATVTVSDNDGNNYPFLEKTRGVYQSNPNVFKGIIGKKYVLKITTLEGQIFQSSEETMMDSPKLESINNIYKDETSGNEGFYVYISFKDLPEEGNYYRWETTFYSIKARCGEINSCCEPCWTIYKKPQNIIISSDENYNNQVFANQEIFIVPYSSRSNAFINIVQYSTSEATYQFWKQMRKQISSVGSIFDPTPTSIVGNIQNIGNKDDKVYGLFSVASKSTTAYTIKRDYIAKNPHFEILPPIPPGPPPPCKPCVEANLTTKIKPYGWSN